MKMFISLCSKILGVPASSQHADDSPFNNESFRGISSKLSVPAVPIDSEHSVTTGSGLQSENSSHTTPQ